MKTINSLFQFTDKDMQDIQSVCLKNYIQYTIIPSLTSQFESYLNGLNFKNEFPIKRISNRDDVVTKFLTEICITTLDELKTIESNIRLQERMKIAQEKKDGC